MLKENRRKRAAKAYKWLLRTEVPVVTALAFVVLGIMAFFTFNISFLSPVKKAIQEFSMTDLYSQILEETGTAGQSPLITIVDMTELISRRDLAQALEDIESCGPKVVGVDMVFEGRKEDVEGDEMIARVGARYANIIWSMRLVDYVDDTLEYVTAVRSFFAEEAAVEEGVTNMRRHLYGGVKRDIDLGWLLRGELQPSFVGKVANMYADKEIAPMGLQEIEVNFVPTQFAVVHADSVLQHPDLITDRIVLFGAMNEEVDMHYTPLGKMPGIELLAYGIQTLIQQKHIVEVDGIVFWLVTFVLVMLTFLITKWRQQWGKSIRRTPLRLFLELPIVGSLLSFLWLSLLLWLAFLLFCSHDISYNPGVAFSAVAFLLTAKGTYDTLLDYLKNFANEETE